MEVLGYSERGMLNALFYEIAYAANANTLLACLLSKVCFPYCPHPFASGLAKAEILIEQSFSDFGDADVVLLVDTGHQKISVFGEAKVIAGKVQYGSINNEFYRFTAGIQQGSVSSSNLFTQLYHKVCLFAALKNSTLQQGVCFPPCSTKPIRYIGRNQVVLRAAGKLQGYLDDSYYIAIIPDTQTVAKNFYHGPFKTYQPIGFSSWDISHYGYLCWEDIETFCRAKNLINTVNCFGFNQGQIYYKGDNPHVSH